MKNKKLMLIATAAMGFVALGAAGVGTAAWYAATGASLGTQTGGTANVTTASSVTTTDSFTVTASFSAPGAVKLTDDEGATYVWDGHNNLLVTDSGTAMAEVTITFTIAYAGTGSPSDAALATMWDAVVDSKSTYKMTCHDNTDYTSEVVPSGGNAPKAIKTAAGANPYGLKFASANNDYDNVGDQDITFNKSEIKTASFVSGSATKVLTTKVYVGVWGIDGYEQKSGDTYVMKVTPAIA